MYNMFNFFVLRILYIKFVVIFSNLLTCTANVFCIFYLRIQQHITHADVIIHTYTQLLTNFFRKI